MATNTSTTGQYQLNIVRGGRVLKFTAGSLSDAQTIAQSYSTLFNVAVELQAMDSQSISPSTATPGSQGTTVSCPSGVTLIPGSMT